MFRYGETVHGIIEKEENIIMKIWIKIGIVVVLGAGIQSCGVNSNLMLKTQKDYEFADIDTLNTSKDDYHIDRNDILTMKFFTNDGIRILEITTATSRPGEAQILNSGNTINYVIQNDSMVNLPVIGEVNLVGKSIREAEDYLGKQYEGQYVNPFIQLSVTNRRVIVFPGNGGEAKVLYLANNNVTLLEAIALAGGITERGRAKKIKLIRKNDEGKRLVYKVDLSKIEGLDYTDIIVQANDYIYVEPVPEIGREVLKEVTPIVSLISSAAIVISVITTL